MEKSPFKRFIALIEFDQSFSLVEKELEDVLIILDAVQDQIIEIEREYEKERASVQALRKEVDTRELEMRVLDEKEKVSRERSVLASTAKEYQSFKKECDQLKQLQHEHEDVLVQAWGLFDQAQKLFEAKEKAHKEQKATLQERVDSHENRKQELLEQLNHREEKRQEYMAGLPEEWLEKYNRMRNRVPNPVVSVVAGTCGGCSCVLTQSVLMALDLNKMMQCSSCYRLMYKNFNSAQIPPSDVQS